MLAQQNTPYPSTAPPGMDGEGRVGGSFMEFEIASIDGDSHGSLANRDVPAVQVIVEAASDELRRLIQQRSEIVKRIGTIKQTIMGLYKLYNLFGDGGSHRRAARC